MIRKIIPLLVMTAAVVHLNSGHSAEDADNAIATVNGQKISKQEFEFYQRRRGLPKDLPAEQQRKMIVDELINMELIYQDAMNKKLDQKEAIQKELLRMKKNLIASVMLRNLTQTNPISDKRLKEEFDQRKGELSGSEYKARHIILDSEDEAKAIIKQLDEGANFIELAKSKSTGPSGAQGGDLGWFNPNEMVPEFSQAVAQLSNGKYTQTPVKTQFGYHVILREGDRALPAPQFEDVKEQLRMRVQNLLVEDYIRDLRSKAKIDK